MVVVYVAIALIFGQWSITYRARVILLDELLEEPLMSDAISPSGLLGFTLPAFCNPSVNLISTPMERVQREAARARIASLFYPGTDRQVSAVDAHPAMPVDVLMEITYWLGVAALPALPTPRTISSLL